MRRFRFPLESAMQYRQMQVDLERGKLESLYGELRRLHSRSENLEAEREIADRMVKGLGPRLASSLRALDNFGRHARLEQLALEDKQRQCNLLIESQQQAVILAQRNYDLLAKLRERQLDDWRKEADRELQTTAEESHISRKVREAKTS